MAAIRPTLPPGLFAIDERMKRENKLAEGVYELHTHYPELRDDFGIFLAAVRDFLAKDEP